MDKITNAGELMQTNEATQIEAMQQVMAECGAELLEARSQAEFWKRKAQEWADAARALAQIAENEESAQDAPDEVEAEEGDDDATAAS